MHIENLTFERKTSLYSINKYNSNISILNQIMRYPKCKFSISIQIDSSLLYDCVSKNNLLNDSIYSLATEILGDNFEYQTEVSHTPKIQVCVESKFHDKKEHKPNNYNLLSIKQCLEDGDVIFLGNNFSS